ncbi:hypothetical protein AB0J90_05395 [Micromonospora sp. NPDC049523]|uniref:hypothetical protein n=1 Tax=Micromonospora sp. NPDC049523 TaxID=3155921 RepID=UPI00343CFB84
MPVDGKSFDIGWLLTHGAGASWTFAVSVQSHLEDADAAYAAEDWPLCVESCLLTLLCVRYCDLVVDGYSQRASEVERHLDVAYAGTDVTRDIRGLPPSVGATREDAVAARKVVATHVGRLRESLPVDVPVLRSAGGFFPTVRLGTDIERLRGTHGLPPLDWYQWDV